MSSTDGKFEVCEHQHRRCCTKLDTETPETILKHYSSMETMTYTKQNKDQFAPNTSYADLIKIKFRPTRTYPFNSAISK